MRWPLFAEIQDWLLKTQKMPVRLWESGDELAQMFWVQRSTTVWKPRNWMGIKLSTSNKTCPWLLCPVWSFGVSKKSFPSMDKLTTYKSIKEEAEIRKFARFKQAERARAGEGPREGARGGERGRNTGGRSRGVKGTEHRAAEIVGEKRELMEGQESGERQSKGKTRLGRREELAPDALRCVPTACSRHGSQRECLLRRLHPGLLSPARRLPHSRHRPWP